MDSNPVSVPRSAPFDAGVMEPLLMVPFEPPLAAHANPVAVSILPPPGVVVTGLNTMAGWTNMCPFTAWLALMPYASTYPVQVRWYHMIGDL